MRNWFRRLLGEETPSIESRCPACQAVEFLDIRPAYKAVVQGRSVRLIECGRCVACISCDQPYVIVPGRPGGVLVRRRVNANGPAPIANRMAAPSGQTQRSVDALASALGQANIALDEPGL